MHMAKQFEKMQQNINSDYLWVLGKFLVNFMYNFILGKI